MKINYSGSIYEIAKKKFITINGKRYKCYLTTCGLMFPVDSHLAKEVKEEEPIKKGKIK